MTKNLTKLWTGGMRRLLAIQSRAARDALKGVDSTPVHALRPQAIWRAAQAAAEQAARQSTQAPGAPARESRVGPRAAAWAAGEWRRAEHLASARAHHAARALPYGLYLPAGGATAGMPLVVMLHGCKQSMDSFAEGTRMNLLADRHGFAVVYPEQSERAHPHQCWHWYDARDAAGGGEAAAVVSLIDALVAEHGFDRSRVYAAGLSAGAGLAMLLAVRWPSRFAAVALHSGPAFGEARSGVSALDVMRRGVHRDPVALVDGELGERAHPGMPAIVLQGDADAVVAPLNAEQLAVQLLRLNGLADVRGVRQGVVSHEIFKDGYREQDYELDGASVVRLCRVAELDHAWSGGDEAVPFHSSTGPDASAMIWDFFRGHRRDAADEIYDDELAQDAR
ncbi:extracellular catalytic domain type 1 short-chain-length polyhydroxyalkanoate depolymerase [Paraburkholderia lycopersici]|uniref:Esterase, PHB depolymerase family n=1 Tax=Paraburkholderia lycopersici TaxID=416944 RepID=A0A1G6WLJ2_9BURK|nr:PHB depolymerase family esterase [Paraburkholderia lycopersici]SDD66553.1 esterase, PHB depolymerase family [Paraburkholderia lycopersici]